MAMPALSSMCQRCQTHLLRAQRRAFSSSATTRAAPPNSRFTQQRSPLNSYAPSAEMEQLAKNAANESRMAPSLQVDPNEPYHLNVYCHKHNTHITFSTPGRDPILSFSAGDLGLRKQARGSFDAAYQLATYTFRKMTEKNWKIGGKKANGTPITLNDTNVQNRGIEVVMRGYGDGREAFQKAILGAEGRAVKNMVTKVTDGTRLKFGGARSRAVRRL